MSVGETLLVRSVASQVIAFRSYFLALPQMHSSKPKGEN